MKEDLKSYVTLGFNFLNQIMTKSLTGYGNSDGKMTN